MALKRKRHVPSLNNQYYLRVSLRQSIFLFFCLFSFLLIVNHPDAYKEGGWLVSSVKSSVDDECVMMSTLNMCLVEKLSNLNVLTFTHTTPRRGGT